MSYVVFWLVKLSTALPVGFFFFIAGPRFPALQIGTAELANWRGDTKRQLAAALDEFAILSRAITAEEVRTIYDGGRP